MKALSVSESLLPFLLWVDPGLNKMKVLLISLRDKLGEGVSPLPLGLACVAAATKEAGYDVRLVSLPTKDGGGFQLTNVIVRFHPDVIGISVRNIDDQDMQAPHFFLAP